MKTKIIICSILIISICTACASTGVQKEDEKSVCNCISDKEEGVCKEYYKNGQLKAEYNCKDGKLEGESRFYYESGALKSRKNYKNGKLDGISTWYFKSGAVDESIYFKDGKRPERKLRSIPVSPPSPW